jgi:hypothetical protein
MSSSVLDRKCVLVVSEALPLGLKLNTAAVLGVTIGRKVDDILGPDAVDASGEEHMGLIRVVLPVLKASAEKIAEIRKKAKAQSDLLTADFAAEAQQAKTMEEYMHALAQRESDQISYLGVAIYGDTKQVNSLTGGLPLLR